MNKTALLRACFSILILVIGNLQAWDSDVPAAGLLIVLIVSLATALPAVALRLSRPHFLGAFVISFSLLVLARLISAIPLPGLFLSTRSGHDGTHIHRPLQPRGRTGTRSIANERAWFILIVRAL